jgi:hypothetical protein
VNLDGLTNDFTDLVLVPAIVSYGKLDEVFDSKVFSLEAGSSFSQQRNFLWVFRCLVVCDFFIWHSLLKIFVLI